MLKNEDSPASKNSSSKSIVLDTSRGMIYDCNMKKLVNTSSKNVTVCLPTLKAFNTLSPYITESEKNTVYENVSNGKAGIITTAKRFNENDISTATVVSRYTENQPCVHLIGHLDNTGNGAMGLEKVYNSYLSQQSGELKAQWSVDALGHILYGENIKFQRNNYLSPAGIQLTIDLDIQNIVENALESFQVAKGAGVVIDADTCEILAVASVPTFNPLNLSADINSTDSPFINRALTPYSVGSVFKPFVAASAVENNIDLSFNCTGSIDIGGTVFKCSNNTAHGFVNMKSAMEKSCNTYFIALGQKIGKEKILNLCSSFGFGKSVELADNFYLNSGVLPTTDYINSPQALANLCFGQGTLLASPVQMAVAYAVFANGGYYRPPTLMKGIVDSNSDVIQKVELPKKYRVMNSTATDKIDSLLESVVSNGNAVKAYSQTVNNRGKTATAQSGWYENGREITHTWFCGYFTHNNKKYVAVIFKEDGTSGAADCAPIFKEISENIAKNIP